MHTCPKCQQINADGNFCSHCGEPLGGGSTATLRLPRQDTGPIHTLSTAILRPHQAANVSKPLGERREVTVLFLDITNFTGSAHNLDAEEIYILLDEVLRELVSVVMAYEGHVDKFTGDGLMALFGAPIAHENDAERAIRAGLDMQHRLQELSSQIEEEHGVTLRARIGINTGPVIAGNVGSDAHMEYTVVGDTVNLASRLENAAEPGHILVSETTYQRARPIFDFRILPPLDVKGKPDPISAFEPLQLLQKPGRVRGLPGMQVPMIGRHDHLEQLKSSLKEVIDTKASRTAFILGDAGVGKSRLIAEFRQGSLDNTDITIYEASCLAFGRSHTYWIIADLLRQLVGTSDGESEHSQLAALSSYLEAQDDTFQRSFPFLTQLLNVSSHDPEVQDVLQQYDASMLHKLTQTAVRDILVREASRKPLVLIFEDLHWVDNASRILLQHLLQVIDNHPIYFILVFRDGETNLRHQLESALRPRSTQNINNISLTALTVKDAMQLVDQLIQTDTARLKGMKKRIVTQSEGNPFYIEEIVRTLIDNDGLIITDGNRWRLTAAAEGLLKRVPGTLQGLIMARFDKLAPDIRHTLQKAAILGTAFPLRLLQALDGNSSGTLASQLREITARQFLVHRAFGGESGYAFQHALMQQAIYSTLLKRDRQRLHEQAARAIEVSDIWLPEQRNEMLAYHYARGENPAVAIPYLLAAAEGASQRYANETAVEHYRRVLELIDAHKPEQDETYFKAKIGLGHSLKLLGSYEKARDLLDETMQEMLRWSLATQSTQQLPVLTRGLLELADLELRSSDYEEALAHLHAGIEALGPDGRMKRSNLWRALVDKQAMAYFRQGKLEKAHSLALSATLKFHPGDEIQPSALAGLYNTLAGISRQQGQINNAIDYAEQSLALYQSIDYAWGVTSAYNSLGILQAQLGQWQEAAESWEEALALVQQTGDLYMEGVCHTYLGNLCIARGRHSQAASHLDAAKRIFRSLGDPANRAWVDILRAQLLWQEDHCQEARDTIEGAILVADRRASQITRVEARWVHAIILANSGEVDTALESAQVALKLAVDDGLTDAMADCQRALGIAHTHRKEFEQAEKALQQSIDLCQTFSDPYRYALGMLALGELYLLQAEDDRAGWHLQALQSLTTATFELEKLGASYYLQQASTRMDQAAQMGPLTQTMPLELEIATSTVKSPVRINSFILWLEITPDSRLDPESAFEQLMEIVPGCRNILEEHGGQVLQQGESVQSIFSHPDGRAMDPSQPVMAAYQAHSYLQGNPQVAVDYKIVICEVDVLLGQVGNSQSPSFMLPAKSLQQFQEALTKTPHGEIWIEDTLRSKLVDQFHLRAADRRGDFVQYWSVLAPQTDHLTGTSRLSLELPLFGRSQAQKNLNPLLSRLKRGLGGITLAEGPTGIGKTRLLHAYLDQVERVVPDARVIRAGCNPLSINLPYAVFNDLLVHLFGLRPETQSSERQKTIIRKQLAEWNPDDSQIAHYLEFVMGLSSTPPTELLDATQIRLQTFASIHRLLVRLATKSPVVIILDDLHWLDDVSADLLLYLAGITLSQPVLFLTAYATGDITPKPLDFVRSQLEQLSIVHAGQSIRIRLTPLDNADSMSLLRAMLPGFVWPDRLRQQLLGLAAGNPYYLTAYTLWLVAQGHIVRDEGRWILSGKSNDSKLLLPRTVQDLIRQRMEALVVNLRQLIQVMAVFGTPIGPQLLSAVTHQPEIEHTLQVLEEQGLLQHDEQTGLWRLQHYVWQESSLSYLAPGPIRALHEMAAETLEAKWQEGQHENAEILAYHFLRAGGLNKAKYYSVLAGEQAAGRDANATALRHFQQANSLALQLPFYDIDLQWRLAVGMGDVQRKLGDLEEATNALRSAGPLASTGRLLRDRLVDLYWRLGETTQEQGEHDAAINYLATAEQFLGQGNNNENAKGLARIRLAQAKAYHRRGDVAAALTASAEAIQAAGEVQALDELCQAYEMHAKLLLRDGKLREAQQDFKSIATLYDQMGFHWGIPDLLDTLGALAIKTGQFDQSQSLFSMALSHFESLGNLYGMGKTMINIGHLNRLRGKLDEAEHWLQSGISTARMLRADYLLARAQGEMAEIQYSRGTYDEMSVTLQDSLARARKIGAHDLLAANFITQARLEIARNRFDAARSQAQEGVRMAREMHDSSLEGFGWSIAAEAALKAGDREEARRLLLQAQKSLNNSGNVLATAQVMTVAYQVFLAYGQLAKAKTAFENARSIYQKAGAQLYLQNLVKGK